MGEVLIEVRPKATAPGSDGLLGARADRVTAVAVESFEARAPEIGEALQKVAEAMRSHLDAAAASGPTRQGWSLDTMELALDLSLEAEAGVVITRAKAGAALSATLTWKRSNPPKP
jgi:hypothetical protein